MFFSNIKLIALDVDGVLTNGRKLYDMEGNVLAKEFNDKDFSALKNLESKGYEIFFISGDNRVNKKVLEKKYKFIREYENKWLVLKMLIEARGIDKDDVVFIGDDWPDIECLSNLKYSICPRDAIMEVKRVSNFILNKKGGEGIIVELYNILVNGVFNGVSKNRKI